MVKPIAKTVVKMTIPLVHSLSLDWYVQYVIDCIMKTPLACQLSPVALRVKA